MRRPDRYDHAFYNCSGLTNVNIPVGVTEITQGCFRGCSKLATVTIPDGVTSIGNYAFYDCSMLKSITIPASVTSIGNDAFRYCSTLAEVFVLATSPATLNNNRVFNDTPDGLKIYVPAASVETYKAGWSAYADKIQALYALTMKEGTQDADKWTVKAGTDGSFQSLPLEGVKAGTKVKLKYDGDRSMVKGVKATSDAKPAATVKTITIAADFHTSGHIATAPEITIEYNEGEKWSDVAARYDWLKMYETYTVYYDADSKSGDLHTADGGVKPSDLVDPNKSYYWGYE